MKYEIVTDSCANLTAEIAGKYGIRIIPVAYKVGGVERLSYGKSAPYEAKRFYGLLRKKTRFTAACASKEDCGRLLEGILQEGADILYIGVSSEINGTFGVVSGAAAELKEKYPQRKILCVDSLCASLGQGKLAAEAAEMRAAGAGLEEAFARTEESKHKVGALVAVSERPFRKAKRSKGLAGLLSATGGGQATVFGRKRALKVLAKRAAQAVNESEGQTLYIGHGDNAKGAAFLIERINSMARVKDYVVNYIDMTLGARFGPGTVAVFFTAP